MAAFASRYARAFSDVLTASGQDVQAAQGQLRDFAEAFAESKQLREVLANPAVPHEQKLHVLDAIAARLQAPSSLRNFIAVLMDHNRIGALDEIVAAFDVVVDHQQGVVVAEVTTAHALGEDERRLLEGQIARLAGATIRASYSEDSSLLGGAVVRVGSTVYDGSMRGQLDSLKRELLAPQALVEAH